MTRQSRHYGVWLYEKQVGALLQVGDHVRFAFTPEYWDDPDRCILGLRFEEHPNTGLTSALRLPPWFSNLLPESTLLREWIARERGVSPRREMELLAQIGHDLPGAVRVFPGDSEPLPSWLDASRMREIQAPPVSAPTGQGLIKFSLAGVGMKFSMRRKGDRLTLPAEGEGGDWIVKLPDPLYPGLPLIEFAMMTLASDIGIDVPEVALFQREQLTPLPDSLWPRGESVAFGVRRFDREAGAPVHIEDLAQVRGVYPDSGKYAGSFETVAALIYRGYDAIGLHEFVRRFVFNLISGNGDAHLKNWSLIYRRPRRPSLSPAYDLVSTVAYEESPGAENLGLRFRGNLRFDRVRISDYEWLGWKLQRPPGELSQVAVETIHAWNHHWRARKDFFVQCGIPRLDCIEDHAGLISRSMGE